MRSSSRYAFAQVAPAPDHQQQLSPEFNTLNLYVQDALTRELGYGRCTLLLHRAGLHLLGHLIQMNEQELLKIKGIGPKKIKNIKAALAVRGLELDKPNHAWLSYRRYLAMHVYH